MQFVFSKKFKKSFKRLNAIDKQKVEICLSLFAKNPNSPKLRNHELKGKLVGIRSISVAFDLRILFIEKNGYALITFLDVGSHSKLYY